MDTDRGIGKHIIHTGQVQRYYNISRREIRNTVYNIRISYMYVKHGRRRLPVQLRTWKYCLENSYYTVISICRDVMYLFVLYT